MESGSLVATFTALCNIYQLSLECGSTKSKLLIPGQNISLPAYIASKIGMQLYSVPVCKITASFPFLLPHI